MILLLVTFSLCLPQVSSYFQIFPRVPNSLPQERIASATFDDTKDYTEYFKIFHVENGSALVGARNFLYNISIDGMTVNQRFPIRKEYFDFLNATHENELAYRLGCKAFPQWVTEMDVCHVYVTNVYNMDHRSFIVFASYALRRIKLILRFKGGTWNLRPLKDSRFTFHTVLFPFQNHTSLVSHEGVHWIGGGVKLHSDEPSIRIARSPTVSDKYHRCNAHQSEKQIWGEGDSMFDVNFLGSFETKHHVYFGFTENGHEAHAQNMDGQKRTRLLRICKNDRGLNRMTDITRKEFALFNKVNLNCSKTLLFKKTPNDDIFKRANRLILPVRLHLMTGMSDLGYGSLTPLNKSEKSPEQMFYALFSSFEGDQPASGICAFNLRDVEDAFNSYLWGSLRIRLSQSELSEQFQQNDLPATTIYPYYVFNHGSYPNTSKCYDDTRALPTWIRDFNRQISLHIDAISPATPCPLYFQTNDTQLHHLVVEWQVEAVNGLFYDILYSGSANGNLYKFISNGSSNQWIVIEERPVFPGKSFAQLKIVEVPNAPKYLLASSYQEVVRVPLASCGSYQTCKGCVGAQDPHCSWVEGMCGTDLMKGIQNISSGHSHSCPMVVTEPLVGAMGSDSKGSSHKAFLLLVACFFPTFVW